MSTRLSELRCVVLGGGGFIGTNLCRLLSRKAKQVKAFGRNKSFPCALQDIEWQLGNFNDANSVATAIEGYDIVFHLVSGSTPASANANIAADAQNSIISTINLLEICKSTSVKRIIFVSSGGTIYGKPSIIPTPESSPTNPITAYGISKLAIEKYLCLYYQLYGIDYRVLRVANPYGPYQATTKNQGVIASFMEKAITGKPIEIWGDGSVERDYIFVGDVVRALEISAVHQGEGKIFNIGSGTSFSLKAVVSMLEKLLSKSIEVEWMDARKVDIPCSRLDTKLAQSQLDFQAKINLQEGLSRTISWAENHYKTK